MLDLAQAVTTGVTVAGALKGLDSLVNLVQRKNGKNGVALAREDHDALKELSWHMDRIHDDLSEMKQLLRDCLSGKRF